MWESVLEKVIIYIVGLALPCIFGGIRYLWLKLNALEEGMQAILCSSIIDTRDECVEAGYISFHKRKNFDKRYNSYKILGADGVIDDLVEDVRRLPVKTKE